MRIGIYAICKNEEKHIDAWYESCKDADFICVADTGSTDKTIKKLNQYQKIQVTNMRISPWRFDFSFNFALALLPENTDICIRLDMDERLDTNWRQNLEKAWTHTTTKLRYPYVWSWNSDGSPGRQWYSDRIHARMGFYWMGHTHEGLCYRLSNEVETITDTVRILHYPDAKDKKNDLPLLIEACGEWPHDARLRSYLGREYMYRGNFPKAIETYKQFLTMSSDSIERGQAMINLATCDKDNKEYWLKCAKIEIPEHREPLVELSQYYYNIQNWENCYKFASDALAITKHPMDYTCTSEAWGVAPHDLLSIAAWNLKLFKESLEHSKLALAKDPNNLRLQNNLKLIEDFFNQHQLK